MCVNLEFLKSFRLVRNPSSDLMEIKNDSRQAIMTTKKLPSKLFQNNGKHISFGFISIIFLILLFSCSKPKSEENAAESKSVEVEIGNIKKQKLVEYINLNATTVYLKKEIIRATFQGYIEKYYKNIGDVVNQGDILFLIKTKESSATDSINFNIGNKKFTGQIKIIAKTSGVLTELNFQTGDYVTEGEQLAVVVDPQSLKIILNVPVQNAKYANINTVCSLKLPDGKTIDAKIIKKMPSIDPANQTQSYILETIEQIILPINLNVIVRIPVKSINDAMVLPKSAIFANETQTEFWIMKLLNDTTAIKNVIVKGIESDSLVQIIEPKFEINDRFITEGGYGMQDTAKINIKK